MQRSVYSTFLNLLIATIVVEMLFPQGDFLRVGENSNIGYGMFLEIILLLYAIRTIYRYRLRIPNSLFFPAVLLILSVFISFIHIELFPYDKMILPDLTSWDFYLMGIENFRYVDLKLTRFLLQFISMMMILAVSFVLKEYGTESQLLTVLRKINYILHGYIAFLIIEVVDAYTIQTAILPRLVSFIFNYDGNGNSLATGYADDRTGLVSVTGISSEPSWLAMSLYFTVCFYVFYKYKSNESVNKIYCLIILMIATLSGSFTSILLMGTLLIYYLYRWGKKGSFLRPIGLFFLVFAIVLIGNLLLEQFYDTYYVQKLNAVFMIFPYITANLSTIPAITLSSGGFSVFSRFFSIYTVFNCWLDRPLFGFGFGYLVSHGGVINTLADIGIIGLLFLLRYLLAIYRYDWIAVIILLFLPNLFFGGVTTFLGSATVIFFIELLRVSKARN